jgi:hypothetical protein
MSTKNQSPKVQRVFAVIGLFSAVGVAIIPNGLFTSTVQATVKPDLSPLGTRKAAVVNFQKSIYESGNINPYLNEEAGEQLWAVPEPGCKTNKPVCFRKDEIGYPDLA